MASVTIRHHPKLTVADVIDVFQRHFGDKYEIVPTPRHRLIDFIVKRSAWTGIAVRLKQHRNKTRLVFYGIAPSLWARLVVGLSLFVLGVFQAFNPKGPFFLTMLAGAVLAVSLTGIRFTTGTCKGNCDSVKEKVCDSVKTTWGRLTFVHSRHKPHLREANHEFKIGNKYFCTGCYGTLIGTTIVLILMSAYVLFGLTADLAFLVAIAVPLCLIPITLRYAVFRQMRTPMRLFSNILLPIGAGLMFILCDYTFHSWIVNVSLVLLILMISFVRITASAKENSVPTTLSTVNQ